MSHPPRSTTAGSTVQDRLAWVPSHKLHDPGPADYSPTKPLHRPPVPIFPTSTRDKCERVYPGWGIPPVASATSITPGPASYELPRAEQKDIPAAIFGKPVVATRRRRGPPTSRSGGPEVIRASLRATTPGPGAYTANRSALSSARSVTLKGRPSLQSLYLGRGFNTGPSPAEVESAARYYYFYQELQKQQPGLALEEEGLDAFSSIDMQRGWSFGTSRRVVSEAVTTEKQQEANKPRPAAPSHVQRQHAASPPTSPGGAGRKRRAPSSPTSVQTTEEENGRPVTAPGPSWLDSWVSGSSLGDAASDGLLSYLRRMQSYTSDASAVGRLRTPSGSSSRAQQRRFLQALARLKQSHEGGHHSKRSLDGGADKRKPRAQDFQRPPAFSFPRGGRFLDCLLERHCPESSHKPQAPPCTRYSPGPCLDALQAIARPITFGGPGPYYRGDPRVHAQVKEAVPGPGTYRLTLAERADPVVVVADRSSRGEGRVAVTKAEAVAVEDSDTLLSTRRQGLHSGGGGGRTTLQRGLSCRFGELATLRSAPRPVIERQARQTAADKVFISTHFLDGKLGSESPGPSAHLDHGKLTPWIRKHPMQFGTQRRGLIKEEGEEEAAVAERLPHKKKKPVSAGAAATGFLGLDVVERAERLTRPAPPQRSFSRGPRKLLMTM